ncbi:unnamed protein product [Brachionus calyciflorus]|uniref:Mitotic-spindle organizing protein 1 n=1 Tax=Brachionus calyciflorus TaxID=104777 RepID=A0A813S513_9BILA|nr:unnamed protein product [Brachionus calyciflorus]
MTSNLNGTKDAMDAMQVVEEIADLLKTGLDKETLSICVRLIENGVNPSPLAHCILSLKRDCARLAANSALSASEN